MLLAKSQAPNRVPHAQYQRWQPDPGRNPVPHEGRGDDDDDKDRDRTQRSMRHRIPEHRDDFL